MQLAAALNNGDQYLPVAFAVFQASVEQAPAAIMSGVAVKLTMNGDASAATWTVDPSRFLSKGRNTPYAGRTLRGRNPEFE